MNKEKYIHIIRFQFEYALGILSSLLLGFTLPDPLRLNLPVNWGKSPLSTVCTSVNLRDKGIKKPAFTKS